MENIALETYGGGTPTTKKKDFWDGDIPWIQSSNLRVDNLYSVEPGGFVTQDAIQQSAAKIIPKNSIAIVTRVGVGKAALIPYNYSTSQDFLSLSGLKVDIFFAIYNIYRHLQQLTQNLQGTSIKGITKKELLNTKTLIPNNQREQKLIGQYFKVLDTLIAANQRQQKAMIRLRIMAYNAELILN
ncbi:restriction endonuclease subunit S [Secundilactobacillus malefermentans]|uniref:restriction endonuclease subunit S n=1 Tax=Secundilactobacillus malefermentans TaxID=176292 RepID=UPI0011C9F971|nr:restriction endonuclease subunit S [Secundilactobacillus malefermentans]QEA31387.1 restriction endonuclease subunit S [Secundilactobacillus malefermentans]